MRVNGREWPPDEVEQPKPIALASAVAFLLVGASPMAALVVWLALPGNQRWALAIWPAGWIVALTVIVLTGLRKGSK